MTEPTKTPALSEYSGAALAYLGDAVMEVLVRRMLVGRGIGNAGKCGVGIVSRRYHRTAHRQ